LHTAQRLFTVPELGDVLDRTNILRELARRPKDGVAASVNALYRAIRTDDTVFEVDASQPLLLLGLTLPGRAETGEHSLHLPPGPVGGIEFRRRHVKYVLTHLPPVRHDGMGPQDLSDEFRRMRAAIVQTQQRATAL
jgi:hypothetical protein